MLRRCWQSNYWLVLIFFAVFEKLACQALEFLRPLETTPALEAVYELVRTQVEPWAGDRYMAPDIEASWKLIKSGAIWDAVKKYL